MSTAGDLVERCFRDYLALVDDEPTTTSLSSGINDSVTSLTIDTTVLTVEEENLLGITTIIEIGTELMRVTAYNSSTGVTTVRRGALATTAASHSAGDNVRVNPAYPRQSVLDAIGDVVGRLYPQLWGVRTENVDIERLTELDSKARGVIDLMDLNGDRIPFKFHRRLGELDDNPGLVVPATYEGEEAWVTYRHSFTRPTALTDDLTEALEAQGFRLGEITSVSTALLRYQNFLIERQAAALRADEEIPVVMNEVI